MFTKRYTPQSLFFVILFIAVLMPRGITLAKEDHSSKAEIHYLVLHYYDYWNSEPPPSPNVTDRTKRFDRLDWRKRYDALDNSAVGKISEMLVSEPEDTRAVMIRMADDLIANNRYTTGDDKKLVAAVAQTLSLKGGTSKVLALRFLSHIENFKDPVIILPLFMDTEYGVSGSAAMLLEKIGTPEILPEFERMLNEKEAANAITKPDYDGSVVAAKQAIKAIKKRAQNKFSTTPDTPTTETATPKASP